MAQISDLKVTETDLKLFLEMYGHQLIDSRLLLVNIELVLISSVFRRIVTILNM